MYFTILRVFLDLLQLRLISVRVSCPGFQDSHVLETVLTSFILMRLISSHKIFSISPFIYTMPCQLILCHETLIKPLTETDLIGTLHWEPWTITNQSSPSLFSFSLALSQLEPSLLIYSWQQHLSLLFFLLAQGEGKPCQCASVAGNIIYNNKRDRNIGPNTICLDMHSIQNKESIHISSLHG